MNIYSRTRPYELIRQSACIFLLFACVSIPLYSQETAVRDDIFAPAVNPAAIGYGNSAGVGYVQSFDTSGILHDYGVFLNGQYTSIFFEGDDQGYVLSPAVGFRMAKNLYGGFSMSFPDFALDGVSGRLGVLFRPLNAVSLAAGFDYAFPDAYGITGGIGVRPFFFSEYLSDRITVSADVRYEGERIFKSFFGLEIEPVNGLKLKVSYDVMQARIGGEASFSFGNIGVGSLLHFDDTYAFSGGRGYATATVKSHRKPRFEGAKRVVDYAISPVISETQIFNTFGPVNISSGGTTIQEVVAEIKSFKEDPTVGALFFRNRFISASYANFLELKEALLDFKSSGKKIYFYFEETSNLNYALAAAVADKIFLHPHGTIILVGFASGRLYYKNLLDMIGVGVINFRSHDYKTAANSYSEENMPDPEREALQFLLDGWFDSFSAMIEEGRGNALRDSAKNLIDKGPYLIAGDALDAGLVDYLVHEDEIEAILQEDDPNFTLPRYAEDAPLDFLADFGAIPDMRQDWSDPYIPKVAVIHAVGPIHTGEGIPGQTIGSTDTAEAIRRAREDKEIKGIIFRVDSGGGSALASEIISREVELCTKGENTKPFIVSMGGVAGSGGYYISAMSDAIVAQPVTVTGSIGVVGMAIQMEELLAKVGLHWDVVRAGNRSDFFSTYREMTEEEQELVRRMIADTYERFIGVVSVGRGMSKDEVHEVAQGRVWTGAQAMERGLVDALGGWTVAVDLMKEKLGVDGQMELVDYGPQPQLLDFAFGTTLKAGRLFSTQNLPEELRQIVEAAEMYYLLDGEHLYFLMPYSFSGLE